MKEIRLYGGGQGTVIMAGELVGCLALAGKYASFMPMFGFERRGPQWVAPSGGVRVAPMISLTLFWSTLLRRPTFAASCLRMLSLATAFATGPRY